MTKKLILDLNDVELDADHQDNVVVTFYICNGEIEITEITGTQKELIQKVKRKMSLLQMDEEYDEEKLSHYKFTFEKIKKNFKMNYLGASPRGIKKPTHKANKESTQGSGY